MVVAVIMAGGKGERFWPKSRVAMPKQLLPLLGERTMIQEAIARIAPIVSLEHTFIVTGAEYASTVAAQLPELPEGNIIIEPSGKNTAPCVGLAAVHLMRRFGAEPITIINLPADHLVTDDAHFLAAIMNAVDMAEHGEYLVTIGIRPSHPETGYGYIRCSSEAQQLRYGRAVKVEQFVEKPDRQTAEAYIRDGEYVWNSGIFVWTANSLMSAFRQHLPAMYKGLDQILAAAEVDLAAVVSAEWDQFAAVSIDYGIMEKAQNIFVVKSEFGWSDVGSWSALYSLLPHDQCGNAASGNHIAIDTKNCVVHSPARLVATIGVSDLIIVETDDVSLVCARNRAQDVKQVLDKLRECGLERYT